MINRKPKLVNLVGILLLLVGGCGTVEPVAASYTVTRRADTAWVVGDTVYTRSWQQADAYRGDKENQEKRRQWVQWATLAGLALTYILLHLLK